MVHQRYEGEEQHYGNHSVNWSGAPISCITCTWDETIDAVLENEDASNRILFIVVVFSMYT